MHIRLEERGRASRVQTCLVNSWNRMLTVIDRFYRSQEISYTERTRKKEREREREKRGWVGLILTTKRKSWKRVHVQSHVELFRWLALMVCKLSFEISDALEFKKFFQLVLWKIHQIDNFDKIDNNLIHKIVIISVYYHHILYLQ